MRGGLVLALLFAVAIQFARAEVFTGVVSSNEGFVFLGKFCYDYDPKNETVIIGSMGVELEATGTVDQAKNMYVLLYSDQANSWPSVYHSSKPCWEKVQAAKNFPGFNVNWDTNKQWRANPSYKIEQHARPRFWYTVIANCHQAAPGGFTGVKFTVHDLNTFNTGNWNTEFGVNDQGLNTLYVFYFIVYTLLVAANLLSMRQLSVKLQYLHPLVKLFASVLALQFVGVICRLIHYCTFVNNGRGVPGIERFGDVMDLLSKVAFVLFLMLLAKGWTISREEMTGRRFVASVVVTFLVFQLVILIWQIAGEDPASTDVDPTLFFLLNFLTALWFLFAFWFLVTIAASWKAEAVPAKKSFYFRLGALYTPWFLGLPFVALMVLVLDPWVRDKVVESLTLTISTLAYGVMSYLLWHARADQYFDISTPDVSGAISAYNQL